MATPAAAVAGSKKTKEKRKEGLLPKDVAIAGTGLMLMLLIAYTGAPPTLCFRLLSVYWAWSFDSWPLSRAAFVWGCHSKLDVNMGVAQVLLCPPLGMLPP